MKHAKTSLTFLFLLAGILTVRGQQIDPNAPFPVDESVRYGVLENGLTYYIKANQEPKERASFYIIQNVGALLEEDQQNGLAHFLEHMAFNGTKHFPDKGIINFLERHGVAFGENINAYTSQNQTVYNLSDVPVNKPGILDTCLLILHDWSHYLLLTEEEIDAERGVIKEEWRTRRTAQFRMYTASLPYYYPHSKFAERDVIGDLDVIENFDYEVLRDFYHTWYRTDLQAIAMAGDFDVDEMERKVKALFSAIPPVENAPERPFFEIPDTEELVYGLVTDREADQSLIRYMIRHRKSNDGPESLLDLREQYVQLLFNQMISQRISELVQKGDPPFVVGAINYGDFERGYEALSVIVIPKPGEEVQGFQAILTELERARRHGFGPGELDRAKADVMTQWEKYYNERDKISNEEYIQDYVDHFLDKKAYLSAEIEFQLVGALLPGISAEEIHGKLQGWIGDNNRILVVQGPEGEGISHLNQEESVAIFQSVASAEVAPYEDEVLAESLIESPLEMKEVVSEKEIPALDAVEWTLSNGVRVIFRHADFEKDQIQIQAYSPGGSSLYGDDYVPTTDMLTSLVSFYGTGDFDATGLQKMLSGKNVSLQLSLGSLSEGISGSATPRDAETLMQLVYLHFNRPRFDADAHKAIVSRYAGLIQNLNNNPQKIMSDSLSLILTDHHPRTRVLDMKFLEEISFEKIEEVYTDRFADASDFFFVIVGNMEQEAVKDLACTYLGNLKDIDRTEQWVDRKVREPEGRVERLIALPLETPKANVNLVYNQEMEYTPYNRLGMRVIQGILDLRYVESIREEEGGTYGVGVRTSLSKWPESTATLQVLFDCDPDRAAELKDKVVRELDKLAQEGPSRDDLDKTVENLLKTREQDKEHNEYYLQALFNLYVYGINFDDPANFEDILRKLTPEDVRKVMKEFYTDANLVDVVFVPDSPAAEASE
ncbi:MAG: insulinase family protein [Bacteroidales bacterium]